MDSTIQSELALLRSRVASLEQQLASVSRDSGQPADRFLRMHSRVLENMTEGVSISDADGIILYTNPAEDLIFGYQSGELIGQHVTVQNAYPPEENQRRVDEVILCLRQTGAWTGEWLNKKKSGEPFYTRARITAFEQEGQFYWVCVQKDVTKQKRAAEALARSEARLKSLVSVSTVGIAIIDKSGCVVEANEAYRSIAGLSVEALSGPLPWLEKTAPESLAIAREHVALLLRGEFAAPFETTFIHSDGGRVSALVGSSFLPEFNEAVYYLVDVSEQKRAQEALRQSEAQLRLVIDGLPGLVSYVDRDFRYRFTNGGYANWFGRPHSSFENQLLAQALGPEEFAAIRPRLEQALGGEVVSYQRVLLNAARQERQVRATYVPDPGPDGAVRGLVAFVEDITETQLAQEAIRESEARYRTLAEALPNLVWTCLPDGACDFLSGQWVAYTGIPEADQLGLKWLNRVVHPDDRERIYQGWMTSVAIDAPYDIEFRLRRHDGVYRWFKTRGTPVRDGGGAVIRWFGTSTDIDDQKHIEAALRASEDRFRTMANSAPVLVWMSGLDKLVTWVNKPWLVFSGRTMEQETGNGWAEQIHPEDREACLDLYSASFDERREFQVEFRLRQADGEWRWMLDRGIPLYTISGEFTGYIGTCVDITDRRRVEEALRRANADLEQFAYAAAHDLQEPARNMQLFTQLLVKNYHNRFDPQADEFLAVIVQSARRMQNLIQDLLAYTRAVDQPDSLLPLVDGNDALEQALQNLRTAIEVAKAEVTSDLLPQAAVNRTHLVQLLQNLISNALKYRSPLRPSRIHVSADAQSGQVLFTVSDNGLGILPEHHQRIFKVFKRLHGRDVPGTGIGLAICQRVVTHYGGRIWVESESGKGAAFRFTLPAPKENQR